AQTESMTHSLSPIGFVGLGLLGQAMALRLQQQGFQLVVWNREAERSAPLAAAGAVVADSPAAVARQCRIVCLCVIDGAAVREVVFGPRGIVSARGAARTVLDSSTVDPAETRALAAEAGQAGLRWIDAPISGGPAAAETGGLTIMVGGAGEDVAAVQPLLQALASKRTHVGAAGSGQEMKVINQALVGCTYVMLAEVLALARRLGLPVEAVPDCLAGGLADSVCLQRVWPRMAAEQFEPPTGRAGQLLKDLKNVDALRQERGVELPLLQAALAQYRFYAEERGGADAESASITRLYDR
ncbi:MAG: 2-hydroxy-3-oxopropionate reductase, partial [Ramlibacter sp.]|nr:2-hydroxy-3-oxopropionate reductase [Ramlibacter sp.]